MIMAENDDKRLHNFFYKNKRKLDELSRDEQDPHEIELSLGLSLNGRFGIDPNRPDNSPLARSSSFSNFNFAAGGAALEVKSAAAGLGRTWSMPVGTEEEWRRKKEVQSVRRMEAKRKRVERMMTEKMKGGIRTARDHIVLGFEENGRIGERHVSVGSQGSSSSGASETEPQPTNQVPVKAGSPGSVQSPPNKDEQKQTVPVGGTKVDKPTTKPNNHDAKEMMKNMMVDMPCVSTRGVGPGGKRIEGFLYRYRKGEEVRIVCVCHGSFLSPAEFIKHAGGGEVSQPLRHIVVNPSPLM